MTSPSSTLPSHTHDPHQLIGVLNARLDALPTRPDVIAQFLTRRGIAGQRGSADCCPLHRYLMANLPTGYLLYVDDHEISMLDPRGRLLLHIPLVGHVTTFLRRFDAGDFPNLTERPR